MTIQELNTLYDSVHKAYNHSMLLPTDTVKVLQLINSVIVEKATVMERLYLQPNPAEVSNHK